MCVVPVGGGEEKVAVRRVVKIRRALVQVAHAARVEIFLAVVKANQPPKEVARVGGEGVQHRVAAGDDFISGEVEAQPGETLDHVRLADAGSVGEDEDLFAALAQGGDRLNRAGNGLRPDVEHAEGIEPIDVVRVGEGEDVVRQLRRARVRAVGGQAVADGLQLAVGGEGGHGGVSGAGEGGIIMASPLIDLEKADEAGSHDRRYYDAGGGRHCQCRQ